MNLTWKSIRNAKFFDKPVKFHDDSTFVYVFFFFVRLLCADVKRMFFCMIEVVLFFAQIVLWIQAYTRIYRNLLPENAEAKKKTKSIELFRLKLCVFLHFYINCFCSSVHLSMHYFGIENLIWNVNMNVYFVLISIAIRLLQYYPFEFTIWFESFFLESKFQFNSNWAMAIEIIEFNIKRDQMYIIPIFDIKAKC